MKVALGTLLILHGLIHLAIWIPAPKPAAPMQTAHSWLFGDVRAASLILAVLWGVVLVAGGVAYLTGAAWWPVAVVAGAAGSAVLMGLVFSPWWLAAIAIDIGLVVWAFLQR